MHPLHTLAVASSIAAAVAFSGTSSAQTTAPVAPTMTPAPTCDKPGDPPSSNSSELGRAAVEMKRNSWNKNMKAYLDCLKKFIEEQQAAAAPHVRAANTAVDDFNKSVKIMNDFIAASSDAGKQ